MVIKCNKGHWYDAAVHANCPHCERENGRLGVLVDRVEEDDKTVSFMDLDGSLEDQVSGSIQSSQDTVDDFDIPDLFGSTQEEDDKTMAFGFFGVAEEIQPVVGWLICISGEETGKDYRLHSGKNFIGRSNRMDVVLLKDPEIAREKHAAVVYDPRGHKFYLSPEEGNFVYLNGVLLKESTQIKENDCIQAGKTEMVFVPYCKEERRWQEELGE